MIERGGPLARLFRQAAVDARTTFEALLAQPWLAPLAAELSAKAHQQLQSGVDSSPLTVLRQCTAGCSACCHTVSVDITPLEAIVVAEHLHANCDAARLPNIKSRLRENAARRARMTADERRQVRLRCGLLGDDGLCQVYAARPLVCAGVFSLSQAACEEAACSQNPIDKNIPLDRPAKASTMGVSGALQQALVSAGLDGNLYELNSIVLCALETTDVARRWLDGEDVFADCVCTDAHSPPRAQPAERRADKAHGIKPPAFSRLRANANKKT